jgi:signal transduction histidine kinase
MAVHDLRTPLHKISLASEVLLGGRVGEDRREELLQIINRASRGMEELIDSLLDFTRMESGKESLKLSATVVPEFFKELCSDLEIIASEKGIQFQYDIDVSDEPLFLDQKRVALVVTNLLSNAFKFSPPGSSVTLALSSNDHLRLVVEDQGPGISDNDFQKLFEPFHRGEAKPTAGEHSTGLGLAICAKIVELHGGDIVVESTPGSGAKFTVELPIIPAREVSD